MPHNSSAIAAFWGIVAQAGALTSPEEIRALVSSNVDVIDDATASAFKEFQSGTRQPNELFALVDSSRTLANRHMAARRSFEQTSGQQLGFLISQTKPNTVEDYIRHRSPDTAVVSFYVRPKNALSVLVARDAPNHPVGYNVIHTDGLKDNFLDMLDAYAESLNKSRPDFSLQLDLLKAFGGLIFAAVWQPRPPKRIVFIPHKLLHLLPLHAVFVELAGKRIFLHDVVQTISYASSAVELLYGNCVVPPEIVGGQAIKSRKTSHPSLLAVLDLNAGLKWVSTEMKYIQLLRWEYESRGMRLDIARAWDELPDEMDPYFWISWSSHAKSSPLEWGKSYLALGPNRISAETIVRAWNLTSQPIVVLAACESAVDPSGGHRTDEYCGLDLAFRIAGAKAAISTLWPVGDSVAAFTSVILSSWCLHHGLTPDHALTQLQRHLRYGKWKELLLRDEQIAQAPADVRQALKEAQEPFFDLRTDAFSDHAHWAVFRCHGG